MFDRIKDLADRVKTAASSTVELAGDVLKREDVRSAADSLKKTAKIAGSEAVKLGKKTAQTGIAKDAASAAAVGAVMGVPIPLIGPVAGATVGATLGVYKNITRKNSSSDTSATVPETKVDVCSELLKLDDLRTREIISAEEFSKMKKRLLHG